MKYKIKTTDNRTHEYSSSICNFQDIILLFEDIDFIILSGRTYNMDKIRCIEEWDDAWFVVTNYFLSTDTL